MQPSTTPAMPMGSSAILPLSTPKAPQILPAQGTPAPAAQGLIASQGAPSSPAPTGDATGGGNVPYDVEMQPDGSSIYFIAGPSGTSQDGVIIAVNPAKPVPRSLQPQA